MQTTLESRADPRPPRSQPLRACALVELHRDRLLAGCRDAFVARFEADLIDVQEAQGFSLLGQFHDLDDADGFVWLRGRARPERGAGASAGPDSRAGHHPADPLCGALRTQSAVRLLRAVRPRGGLVPAARCVPAGDAGQVEIHLLDLMPGAEAAFAAHFERRWLPLLWNANIPLLATYASAGAVDITAPTGITAADTSHFVWITRFAHARAAAEAQARIEQALEWKPAIADEFATLVHAAQRLRLAPTPRSRLRA